MHDISLPLVVRAPGTHVQLSHQARGVLLSRAGGCLELTLEFVSFTNARRLVVMIDDPTVLIAHLRDPLVNV